MSHQRTPRQQMLAALVAERFPRQAIEDEGVQVVDTATVQLARVLLQQIEDSSWDSPAEIRRRRLDLLGATGADVRQAS